jgi:methionyl-tRNA formyltransferase
MKVHAIRVLESEQRAGSPAGGEPGRLSGSKPAGQVLLADKSRIVVACGNGGAVELVTVQPEGKRAIRAAEWVMGRGVAEGDLLGP